VVLVAMAWGYTQLFTGRASLLHLGAFTATIMSANVFDDHHSEPEEGGRGAESRARRPTRAMARRIAKQRSLHNNYLTLPVIFLMLSNHYPLAFATPYNWVIASLVFLMGVTIRHYLQHQACPQGQAELDLGLATPALFVAIVWLSSNPRSSALIEEAELLAPVHERMMSSMRISRRSARPWCCRAARCAMRPNRSGTAWPTRRST
jgi:uncharacterized membrane protein